MDNYNRISVIADVHGEVDEYLAICRKLDYTVQIGDMGFKYDHLDQLEPSRNKFFGGNHDNFDKLEQSPPRHYLGRFGSYELNGVKFFWISGAYSVDKAWRTEGKNWFRQEEFTAKETSDCLRLYDEVKPDIVLSHDCPVFMLPYVITNKMKVNPSMTAQFLKAIYLIHAPKLWVFGHHHQNARFHYQDTDFIVLNELCHLDIIQKDGIIKTESIQGKSINCRFYDNFDTRNEVTYIHKLRPVDYQSGSEAWK